MFTKLFIANRGEIAVRLIRACRELGIDTVAAYSEADADAPHVWLADEAVLLGPAAPAHSYLAIDKIVSAARESGCDALHPGYGFLAENADFAQAVLDAGITFVGPTPQTIRAMGSKTAARATMQAAGVLVVPGFQGDDEDSLSDAALLDAADGIGFPLLVKAAAGGGGKGMRVVSDPAELPDALAATRREAAGAFGDGRLFLEKLVERPRHIEFQILGDSHGNLVHLFERECSIQRRHQKIVEETPSPFVDEELRARMAEAALAAARAVDYVNAGTVEFLVDEAGDFYFLEMNTRLQVEHPITELATGVDLVQTQIRVAAGEPLPFTQADLRQRGHAIECRIYAEDAAHGFLPATAHIALAVEPSAPGVRVDSGIGNNIGNNNVSGSNVSVHYDPMLAKLIVHAPTRDAARAKMLTALRNYVVLGDIITNIDFLHDVIAHPAFASGDTTTAFLGEHFAEWSPNHVAPPDDALIVAALVEHLSRRVSASNGALPDGDFQSPWQRADGFRLGVAV